jgi:hypothetical protein
MQVHSTPVPSLIVVGGGIGEFVLFSFFRFLHFLYLLLVCALLTGSGNSGDLRMPNGRCLRVKGGDLLQRGHSG